MSGKGLPIIEERVLSKKEQFEEKTRSFWEEAWSEESEKYDPSQTVLGKERVQRTAQLLPDALSGKRIADLGCGTAPFASYLSEADLTFVDVAEAALNRAPASAKHVRSTLPYCRLPEESFDGVLLTDVIADLEPHLYRLMLSEVSALLKREGFFLCSTELDLHSEDALPVFLDLIRTEFEVVKSQKSYHRLYFYLRRCLDAPARFVRAGREPAYRLQQLNKRAYFSRLWFYLNSIQPICYLWLPLKPLKSRLQSRSLLLFLERLSQLLFGEAALTHIALLCRKKSLQLPIE
ncbi:MAG: hypothetical protein S4CHLAM2_08280 [Chlamydiales bacterium]|nr:hypothetical protein [Chlamydiales bacterium]